MEKVKSEGIHKTIGLILGLVFFAALLCVRFGDSPNIHRMAAIAALMATWWMTEAIPLAATSLMPLVLMPVLQIAKPDVVAKSYMNDYIFLFVGGFTVALAMEKWNLHRRIALHTIRLVGDRPSQVVLGFMLATAFISLWISNTATAMMMMPIALSVVLLAEDHQKTAGQPAEAGRAARFGLVVMLGIAYAASIGGMGTLIGTPPNLVFAERFHRDFPGAPEINFARWLVVGLPFSAVFLIVTWVLLSFVLYPLRGGRLLGGRGLIQGELAKLGRINRPEIGVLVVFLCAALLWIFRAEVEMGAVRIGGWSRWLGLQGWVGDGTVAMVAGLSLFFIPSGQKKGERLVDWKVVEDLPWNVLFLFGGGFALADGFIASGLSEWVGQRCLAFGQLPVTGQILAVSGTITFLTELTSNTATANMVLPILSGVSKAIEVNPLVLMVPATLSASCAFMLPVATPPNAIVFGTGYVPIGKMVRAGLVMNFIGMILVLLLIYFVAIPLWGIDPATLPSSWLPAAP